jgi:hypothetical protein
MSSLSGALSGEPILSGPYDPATQGARVIAARAATGDVGAAGGNFDLLGFAKVAASAILGGATSDAAVESSPDMLAKSFGGDGASGSLPADARAFDYLPDEPSGEVVELAGMPFNGEPGTWISSMPGTMPQLRQYGPNGTPLTDFDFDSARRSLGLGEVVGDRNQSLESRGFDALPVKANHQPEASLACECGNALLEA